MYEDKYEDNVRLLSSSFNGTYETKPVRECFFGCLCQEISPGRPMRVSTTTKLLISCVKPHRAITSNTISRWIKQVLTLSGIDATIFKARSTRAASVSKASQFLPVDAIHKHVGWSSDCVFRKCYHKPALDGDAYQTVVLYNRLFIQMCSFSSFFLLVVSTILGLQSISRDAADNVSHSRRLDPTIELTTFLLCYTSNMAAVMLIANHQLL